jgi:hypothetical protein
MVAAGFSRSQAKLPPHLLFSPQFIRAQGALPIPGCVQAQFLILLDPILLRSGRQLVF